MSVLANDQTRSALFGFAVVVLVGFDDGGYFARSWGWAGFALAAVAVAALLLRERIAVTRLEVATIGSVWAFAGWAALSGSWGTQGSAPLREAERALLYVIGLGACLLVVERRTARTFLIGVLAGVLTLSAYGLGEVLLRSGPPDPYQGNLLFQPIGYANAHGLLAAIGVLLSLGLVVFESRTPLRGVAVAALAVLLVALVLTESRGAWISLAIGVLVMAVLTTHRRRAVVAAVSGGALLLAVVTVVAVRPSIGLGDRSHYWKVALEDFGDHPWLGSGAGSFHDVWRERRPVAVKVRDAHSLYLESLAELGPLGLALVVSALGVPLIAAVRARDHTVVPLAAAAYSAFLVHAGLDWDWEMPVVTLTGLFCGCALHVSQPNTPGHDEYGTPSPPEDHGGHDHPGGEPHHGGLHHGHSTLVLR